MVFPATLDLVGGSSGQTITVNNFTANSTGPTGLAGAGTLYLQIGGAFDR